jgi:hypothetical protein
VQSLNELGMAGRASRYHPSSQLAQMFPMGKTDVFKNHLSPQVVSLVAPLLQTIPIIYFVMEFLESFSNHYIGQSELEIYPFPFKMV